MPSWTPPAATAGQGRGKAGQGGEERRLDDVRMVGRYAGRVTRYMRGREEALADGMASAMPHCSSVARLTSLTFFG